MNSWRTSKVSTARVIAVGLRGFSGSGPKRGTHMFALRTDTTLTHLSYALLKEVSCGSIFFFSSSGCSYWESTYIKHKQLFPYFLITMASGKTLELLCLLRGHKNNSSSVPLKQLNFCLCCTQGHRFNGENRCFCFSIHMAAVSAPCSQVIL